MVYNFVSGVKQDERSRVGLLLAGIASAITFAVSIMVVSAYAATTTAVDCANLPTAIAAASAGDTLIVSGSCTLTTNTVIDKQLTIKGDDSFLISTNGTAQIFTIVGGGAGTVFDNVDFLKTDKTGVQNIIGVQADNVSVVNSSYKGQFVIGDGDVSRAVEVSTVNNFTFSGNTVDSLRQPAYINDLATGTISNNYVTGTKGFVLVANTNFSFTGNSWGTNVLDIAFIPGTPNNYPCSAVKQIRMDNNNANIQNQAQVPPCPTYPLTKEECKDNKWKTYTETTYKNQGQCVSSVASNKNS